MKYVVHVTETLQKGFIVDADNFDEAKDKVNTAYNDELIVLDSQDYIGYEIECESEADEWALGYYPKIEEV